MVSDDVVESVSSSKFHADPEKEKNKTDWIAKTRLYLKLLNINKQKTIEVDKEDQPIAP